MVLSTEWSQVEVIDLVNDGSGLGFGIVGGRSTGVVIKSILPGGIADKDGRLQSGDHILQIGEVNLCGLSADQVATVLRQAGAQVRMVVARPVEPTSSDFQNLGSSAPIVPTKILTDPEELDRQLQQNGYTSFSILYQNRTSSQEEEPLEEEEDASHLQLEINLTTLKLSNSLDTALDNNNTNGFSPISEGHIIVTPVDVASETERYTVELRKNEHGLGVTVAGYVCEREDLSGIFVKSLSEGSDAYNCGLIDVNDRIVEVDGGSVHGLSNHQAVERLKQTGECVRLTLERYLSGPKFDQLREALLVTDEPVEDYSPPSPSATTLSWIPIETPEEQFDQSEGGDVISTVCGDDVLSPNPESREIFIEENFEVNLESDLESVTKKKWENLVENGTEIIVANLTKLKGLGISLEGTVDVEGGVELRPHHYIRSILPEGPVGQNGKLSSGDELLEVNGQKLLGIKHVDVVRILRELPNTVRLVCARKREENRVINTSQDREGFEARNILGGSLKNLLPQQSDTQRLLKALSDTSINTSSTVTVTDESVSVQKSKSLEVTNVAMWSDHVEYVELTKTDRGLGFSILDYQDPSDPKCTVIVVRSLVPNGAAQSDGRITPGDQLVSVDDTPIRNCTLDGAVRALKGTLPGLVRLGICKPLPGSRATTSAVGST